MRHYLLSLLVLLTASVAAQSTRLNNDAKGIIYNREKAIDLRLHTHGWAANFLIGELKSYHRTNFYRLGIGELKHHKEVNKSTDWNTAAPGQGFRQYVFGKQNYNFVLRGGFGVKRYFTEKADKKGVAIGLSYSGGITTAMMLPYYLEIGGARDSRTISTKYSVETAGDFTDPYKIKGKSGVFKGVSELKIVPGIHGQIGAHLDWGAFDEFLRAVEVGVMLDIFYKKLPIMVTGENRPYFFNLYASIQLGKRN